MTVRQLMEDIKSRIIKHTDDVYLVVISLKRRKKDFLFYTVIGPFTDKTAIEHECKIANFMDEMHLGLYNIKRIQGRPGEISVQTFEQWKKDVKFREKVFEEGKMTDTIIESGELKNMKVGFAGGKKVDQLKKYVDIVMDAMGIREAWLSDLSTISDFCLRDLEVADMRIHLGVDVDHDDYIWQIAERVKIKLEQENNEKG